MFYPKLLDSKRSGAMGTISQQFASMERVNKFICVGSFSLQFKNYTIACLFLLSFPLEHYGKILGLARALSGLLNFLSYGFSYWSDKMEGGETQVGAYFGH